MTETNFWDTQDGETFDISFKETLEDAIMQSRMLLHAYSTEYRLIAQLVHKRNNLLSNFEFQWKLVFDPSYHPPRLMHSFPVNKSKQAIG